MPRVKLSEYSAKQLLFPVFKRNYRGFAATPNTTARELLSNFGNQNLVVKVDQGIKKRNKLGLVRLNTTPSAIPNLLKNWHSQGWNSFLVEEMIEHSSSSESYLSLERVRHGWRVLYSKSGGVDIESNWDKVNSDPPTFLSKFIDSQLIPVLDQHHISFIEINPLILRNHTPIPLDMAVEVDSSASTLPTLPDRALTFSEQAVLTLDNSTPASLKFRLINPHGKIWMLLSGGGASLVLADEVADLGLGGDLANYGEYSGAPTDDDVYAYTSIILKQLLSHKTNDKKAIIIAGGVANFTDVAKTFRGLIRALDEQKSALKKAHVKVFVRRGGPNEEVGLKLMRDFLSKADLLGRVYGHQTALTQVVSDVLRYLT